MSMENIEKIKRWRLILGEESQDYFSSVQEGKNFSLSEEQILMDQALAAIYNQGGKDSFAGGKNASSPQISKWLGDIRSLLDRKSVV